MKNKITLILFITISSISFSQQIQEKEVYTYANATMVENLLDAKEIEYTSIKFNTYKATLNGYTTFFKVADENLYLTAIFSDEPSLNRVNDFNAKYRWCRVYLDSDGDLTIEAELSFAGGVSIGNINTFVNTFGEALKILARDMN